MTNKHISIAFVMGFVGQVALAVWIAILSTVVIDLRRDKETLQIRLDNLSSRVPPRDPPPPDDASWKPTGMFDGIGPPKMLEFRIE